MLKAVRCLEDLSALKACLFQEMGFGQYRGQVSLFIPPHAHTVSKLSEILAKRKGLCTPVRDTRVHVAPTARVVNWLKSFKMYLHLHKEGKPASILSALMFKG